MEPCFNWNWGFMLFIDLKAQRNELRSTSKTGSQPAKSGQNTGGGLDSRGSCGFSAGHCGVNTA